MFITYLFIYSPTINETRQILHKIEKKISYIKEQQDRIIYIYVHI